MTSKVAILLAALWSRATNSTADSLTDKLLSAATVTLVDLSISSTVKFRLRKSRQKKNYEDRAKEKSTTGSRIGSHMRIKTQ